MSTIIEPPSETATLHLTQILVSFEDAVRLLRIGDTYDWHQRVWQAFGFGLLVLAPNSAGN
jgi:hypothetical protein